MRRRYLAVVVLLGVGGDAALAQEGRDMRLEDAGFVMRPADTEKHWEVLRKFPTRKFVTRTVNGKRYYYFADPDYCRCVMVGDDRAMQAFRDMRARLPQVPNVPPAGVSPENEIVTSFDSDLGDTEPNTLFSVPF